MEITLAIPASQPAPIQVRLLNFMEPPVRAFVDEQRDPWFLAKDVCAVLGIANHNDAVAEHPESELRGSVVATPFGGKQTANFVNESGFYRLVFKSRKPEAETFKTWVFREVLPAIRKRGYFRGGFLALGAPKRNEGARPPGRPTILGPMLALDYTPLRERTPSEGLCYSAMLNTLEQFGQENGIGGAFCERTTARLLVALCGAGTLARNGSLYRFTSTHP